MLKPEKKLCCVIPSLKAGGMERVMTELINNFAKRENICVHLILYGKGREIFYSINSQIIKHIPHFEFKDFIRTISTIRTMRWLRKEIKKISPSVVLSFGEYWNNLVLLTLSGLPYPIFVSDRFQPDKNLGRIHEFLRTHLYKKAKGIICQTNQAKSISLKRHAYENIAVIGNPIRNIDIQGNNTKANVIISIGRMINTKHFDRLITVFSRLSVSSWKLMIIGGDSNKQHIFDELKSQIKALKLENKVLLEGYQSNVEKYLLQSKIFAFMSSSEGFPNVIGEAMSAGLPVVAYDCVAGPRDMIDDGKSGYLVPLYDDDLFLEKLEFLISNEEEREKIGSYAKQSIMKFDANIISENFYQFITG